MPKSLDTYTDIVQAGLSSLGYRCTYGCAPRFYAAGIEPAACVSAIMAVNAGHAVPASLNIGG